MKNSNNLPSWNEYLTLKKEHNEGIIKRAMGYLAGHKSFDAKIQDARAANDQQALTDLANYCIQQGGGSIEECHAKVFGNEPTLQNKSQQVPQAGGEATSRYYK